MSILSAFIKQKIKDKGWSIRKFAEEANMSETHVYELVSAKRDFTPNDETLNKIGDVLVLNDEDRKYILNIAEQERETGNIIFPESEVPPAPPQEPPPQPLPQSENPPNPSEPQQPSDTQPLPQPESPPSDQPGHDSPPPSSPNDTVPLPSPSDPPVPPQLPVPQSPGELSWFQRHRTLLIVGGVLLLGFGLMGCCVVAFLIKSLGLFF